MIMGLMVVIHQRDPRTPDHLKDQTAPMAQSHLKDIKAMDPMAQDHLKDQTVPMAQSHLKDPALLPNEKKTSPSLRFTFINLTTKIYMLSIFMSSYLTLIISYIIFSERRLFYPYLFTQLHIFISSLLTSPHFN